MPGSENSIGYQLFRQILLLNLKYVVNYYLCLGNISKSKYLHKSLHEETMLHYYKKLINI